MPAAAEMLVEPPFERSPAPDDFQSAPDPQKHDHFIREAVDTIINEAVYKGTNRESRVVEWLSPDELSARLDLSLDRAGLSQEKLLSLVEQTIRYSVKPGHPYFVNQLFSSVDPYGLVGQWLGDALNPSVYTYEVAPVFTLMEETVLGEMRAVVGFPREGGDGIFCPGGSMANGYAISCARHYKAPHLKTQGMSGQRRMVVFTSEDAHYSIKKMAVLQGFGSDNVRLVKTDARGRMDARDLEAQVKDTLDQGALPIMVSATSGTTVLGAFDPLEEIYDVCAKYEMWMHVDAAWGGGALLSRRHRHLLKGIERADSVTWNPHKMLAAPQQCSTFLTRHASVLTDAHAANAAYLFQKDKFYDTSYDTGDKHLQCGRRADVLKFWFMWKAKGTDGLEAHIDKLFDNATYFKNMISERPGFELVLEQPECTNICFWYVPASLRSAEARSHPDYNHTLHKVAPKMKERMIQKGSLMVTYQPLRDLPNFFRLVLQNSSLDHKDMDYIIEELERLGSDL
ncbi:cysteine sulfinic acid decarboxylase [Nilaparvata lugens]|nr:cysteine sulfinic acid decarboxylase [Nilaparvata lugens]